MSLRLISKMQLHTFSLTLPIFNVRGKAHGVQGIKGLRFMSEKLIEELKLISNETSKTKIL